MSDWQLNRAELDRYITAGDEERDEESEATERELWREDQEAETASEPDEGAVWRLASNEYAASRRMGIMRAVNDTLNILSDSMASPADPEEADAARSARQFLAYWWEVWQRERRKAAQP